GARGRRAGRRPLPVGGGVAGDDPHRPGARPGPRRGARGRPRPRRPPPPLRRQARHRRAREAPAARPGGAAVAGGDPHVGRGAGARRPALARLRPRPVSALRHFLEAIKVEHTVFALPFAYLGMVLAARGWPGLRPFLWITLAMVAARTTAMAATRLIDRHLDAQTPRTAGRHLPRGLLQPRDLALAASLSAALFLGAAWRLGPLCLALAPLALVFLVGYSYTKRFTWTSHWILGFTDGAAAAGAWIAVRGRMDPPAWLLWLAVTVWIAGFDLLYACQDVEFDRREGLHSVPARFG